jgi:hypothetical protein
MEKTLMAIVRNGQQYILYARIALITILSVSSGECWPAFDLFCINFLLKVTYLT